MRGGAFRASPAAVRVWAALLCAAMAAAALQAARAGPVGAQVVDDPDSVPSGATDLGDLTDLGPLGPNGQGRWNGQVGQGGDAVDYFMFSLSRPRLVGAGLRSMRKNADIFVEDGNGNVLASSRSTGNAREWLNAALGAGTHYIRVEAQEPGGNNYRLQMGTAGADPVSAGFDTSAEVSVGGELRSSIDPYWDLDLIRVELAADTVYALEVRGRDSGSGTLMDPELTGVYVDPSDAAVLGAYGAVNRVASHGKICNSGLTPDALAGFPVPPEMASSMMDGGAAHDFDDGTGVDAWLLFRAEATGSHYIKVASQGGFTGTYTAAATEMGASPTAATGRCRLAEEATDESQQRMPPQAPRIVVDTTGIQMKEGSTSSFTVKLDSQPSGDVTVSVVSADTGAATVDKASLTFTATTWSTAQTVTVTGVGDVDAAAESVSISLSASGGGYDEAAATVTAAVADDDAGLVAPASVDVVEGSIAAFDVVLAAEPSGDVTVAVVSADTTAATVDKATLTFTSTNWSTAQAVTVTGVADTDAAAELVSISLSASGGGYDGATAAVTANVADDDAGLVAPASVDVVEGSTAAFTVKLAAEPSGDVTVAVVSADTAAATVDKATLTFTSTNWSTAQTVTVTGVADSDGAAESVAIALTASGGGYDGAAAAVTANVADDDAGLVAPASVDVVEGSTGAFTVKLAAEPSGDVTVAVVSADTGAATVDKATLTFTSTNWSTAQTVTVTGVGDPDAAAESVSIALTATGGGYDGTTAAVTANVADDDAGITAPATIAVDEGSTASFDVALAAEPSGDVTVTVVSADTGAATVDKATLTFTTTTWSTAQTVTVTGVADADGAAESVDIALTASGGGYDGAAAAVTAKVADDDAGLVAPSSVDVVEGSTAAFSVQLAAQPSGNVTVAVVSADTAAATVDKASLTFTASNWSTAQTVTVTGVADADGAAESVDIALTASGGGYDGAAAAVTANVADDDAGLVAPSSVDVVEGSTAEFTIRLAAEPSGNVTVAVVSADTAAATVDKATLTFAASTWSTAQTVTVTGVADDDAAAESVSITLSASGGGYDGASAAVTANVADDDAGLVAPSSVDVVEGSTGVFTVKLAAEPSGDVTVAVVSADAAAATVDKASLTFTASNWSTAQTVTVTGVADADGAAESVGIALTASGGGYDGAAAAVTAKVADDDAGLVAPSSVDVVEGSTAGFTVKLAAEPSGDVTVAVVSADTAAATVNKASLTFTASNWATAQTVTVTGVADDDGAAESVSIALTASGGGYDGAAAAVTANVADDDAGLIAPATIAVDEGSTAGFTVKLAAEPSGNVTVAVASADTGAATVDKASLAFTVTNWSTAQTVTVTGVADEDAAAESVAISLSASGGGYDGAAAAVTANVADDDAGLIAPATVSVDEGSTGTFSVKLAAEPSGDVTVAVVSADAAAATVDKASLTFTASNWSTAQTVTVTGVADDDGAAESVSIALTASGGGYDGAAAAVTAKVADDDAGLVAPSSVDVVEGSTAGFTVKLAAVPSGDVTVAVVSADTGAATVDKASLTFTVTNWSTEQTVTVTGVADDDGAAESVSIALTASGGGYDGAAAAVTANVADDDAGLVAPASVDVVEGSTAEFAVKLAAVPSGDVTVAVVSADTGAATVDKASLAFTVTNWSTEQTVTVTGVADDDGAAESVAISLSASGGGYDGAAAAVTANVADDDAGLIAPATVSIDEGSTGTFSVKLAAEPSGDVTVTVVSADTGAATVDKASLAFTVTNWSTEQTVTVTGVADDDGAAESVAISLSASGGGYDGAAAAVTANVADDDAAITAPAAVAVDEGSTAAFDVALAAEPSGDVTVAVVSADTGAATVDKATLTFTNTTWSTAQTVTITGVADADAAPESVSISLSASGGGYDGAAAAVTANVADDDAAITAPAAVAVDEGSTAAFDVALAAEPSGDVTVTVVSADTGAATVDKASLAFTVTNWSTAQTVTVTGVSDDDAAAESVSISLSASGGGYDGTTAAVTANVADDDAGLVAPATVSAVEGSTATFDVQLAAEPSGDVTVTVVSADTGAATVDKATLTFTASTWSTAQTVTVTGVSDDDGAAESVAISLSASGGGYDGNTAAVTANVADDDAGISAPAAVAVDEGSTAAFDVQLAAEPSGDVTVTVASADTGAATVDKASLAFTASTWSTAQTVTITGVADADGAAESVAISLAASGGGYDGNTAAVTANVADDDAGLVAPATVSVDEGSTAEFTVKLAAEPSGDVTVTVVSADTGAATVDKASLTFTVTNWSTAQTVTITGVADDDGAAESVAISLAASGGGYDGNTAAVTANVADDDAAITAPASVDVVEGSNAGFTVKLAAEPSGDVTVTVLSADTGAATVDKDSLAFTVTNWSTAQTVTVTGVADDDGAAESVVITLAASGGGYDGAAVAVTANVADDDSAITAPATIAVDEGSTAAFDVQLAAVPSGDVTVTVVSADTGAVTVDKASLAFTASNWSTAQTVTVTGVADADAAAESVSISLSASGGGYDGTAAAVTANVADDDAAITAPASVDVDEGSTASFDIALAAEPSGDVAVAVASADVGAVAVDKASLAFTASNWSTAQTVTVTGVADADGAAESVAITLAASGGGYDGAAATVTAAVADDDAAITAPASVDVDEGSTAAFDVQLAAVPSGDVTVTVVSADTGAVAVDKASLAFTVSNWSTAQTVTVTGVADDDGAAESIAISLTASGGGYDGTAAAVTANVADDDAAITAPATVAVDEGSTASFDVALAAEPSGDVTVAVASADVGAVTVDKASLAFTASNWSTAQTVTVTGVADDDGAAESVAISLSASGGGYDGTAATVTAAVADDDAGITAPATVDVDEGSTASFDVQLAAQPSGDVTVAVASADTGAATVDKAALTFTATTWSTAQTVTVTGVADDDGAAESVAITLAASGGGYDGTAAVVTANVSDDDAGIAAPASADVVEGSTAEFTVKLAAEPSGDVTVAVVSADTGAATVDKASLAFTATNWSTAQTVTVTGVADDDGAAESVAITLAASGGGYDGTAAVVTANVSDDDAGLVAPASVDVVEGSTAAFEVQLAAQPSGDVTVTVVSADTGAATVDKSSLTFTVTNWSTEQTVTVTGVSDDDGAAESVAITLAASGGGYDGAAATVTAAVADDDAAITAPASVDVDEGSTAGFTVKLAAEPSGDVNVAVVSADTGAAMVDKASLTFTVSNWSTEQTVTITGVGDADGAAESVSIALTASGGGYDGAAAAVTANVADDDAGINAPATVDVDEGSTASFDVALAAEPSGDVTVAVVSADTGAVTVDKETLTFTASNWSTAQTVTVTGVADADGAAESVDISLTASGGGYDGTAAAVTANVADDDAAITSPASVDVDEGSTAAFDVALAAEPSGDVIVAVVSADTGAVTVDKATLTFTVTTWSTAQTVTVAGVADADGAAESVSISLTASGGGYDGTAAAVTANVADDDAGLVVPAAVTVDEGSTAEFTVKLAAEPSGDVNVAVVSADTGAVTVDKASLTFTTSTWSTAQTVTVTGVADADGAAESVDISLTASGGGYDGAAATVTAAVADDDAGLVVPAAVTVDEGSTAEFTVKLAAEPSGDVTVAVVSADTGAATVDKASLAFTATNWATAQTVTVTGVADADAAAESVSIALTASGGGYDGTAGAVTANVADDDAAITAPASVDVDEGSTASFDVALAAEPSGDVTVAVVSADTGAATVDKASLAFTASNWSTAQTVTVTGVADSDGAAESVSIALTASGGGYDGTAGAVTANVADDDAAITAPASVDVDEGSTAAFDVQLAARPSGDVTVAVASADAGAATVDKASLTFTVTTWSTAQTVTITGVADDDGAAESVSIALTASGGGYDGTAGAVTANVADDDAAITAPASVDVDEGSTAAFDVALAAEPSGDVTVAVVSADTGAATVDKETLTFTVSTWSTGQTVTVTGVGDDDGAAESVSIALTASGGGYDGTAGAVTANVADDDAALTAPAAVDVVEGSTAAFDVALAAEPSGDVTVAVVSADTGAATVDKASLAFTTSTWATAQTVTITGVADADGAAESVGISLTASGGGYDGTAAAVTAQVADDDAGIAAPAAVDVVEGSTASFDVALAAEPSGDVTVAVVSADTGAVTVDKATLTFTVTTWATAQTVTVTGVADADAAPESVSISLSASGGGYDGNTAAVTANVADDDAAITAPAAVDVVEGSTASFDVALAAEPSGDVTVAVVSADTGAATVDKASLAFTTSTWATAQTVTVTGVGDDDGAAESVGISLTASGGGYDGTAAAVTANVADDDAALTAPAAVDVVEGSTASFDVALAAEPSGDVTVAVVSADTGAATVDKASLAFTASTWATAQTVTVTGVADADGAAESVDISLTASGGGYDGTAAAVTANVADDDAAITAPAAVDVVEGSTAAFDVALAAEPSGDVTVAVVSADTGAATVDKETLTFTVTTWSTAQTVTVTGVADADGAAESVDISLTASGGGYDGTAAAVTANVADDDAAITAPASVDVVEGSTASFDVALAAEPSGDVTVAVVSADTGAATVDKETLTFTTSTWSTAQTVTITGVADADGAAESVGISLTASGGGYDGTAAAVTAQVADDDAGLVVPASVDVDEGSTAEFTVKLAAEPSGDVTVAVVSADTGAATVDKASLAFTATNWSTAQTVTVTGVADADAAPESVGISLTASGGGYDGTAAAVTADVADDDAAITAPKAVAVDEESTASFDVALAAEPSGDVTVAVVSADTGAATVDKASLAFTASNWSTTQMVTVTGVADSDGAAESVSISLSASGGGYDGITAAVTASVADDDAAIIAPAAVAVDEESTAEFKVELAAEPSGDVTVAVVSADTGAVTVDKATLTFTDKTWSTAQTVTVTGVADADAAPESVSISLAASGGGYDGITAAVTASVADDDAAIIAPKAVAVDEESTAEFKVKLAAEPSGDVTVAVVSADTGAVTVDKATLTFPAVNWSTEQTVTVTGVDDDDDDDETVDIALTASGGGYDGITAAVTAEVADDDELPPMAPDGLRVVREERTQATVRWNGPGGSAQPITGYTVRSRLLPGGTWVELPSTELSRTLTGLSPGSSYEVQVQAKNTAGGSQWSDEVVVYADDCGTTSATACSLSAGTDAAGRVNVHDSAADRDRFAVTFKLGHDYTIDVKGSDANATGGTLGDPELIVYDDSQTRISGARDNDSGAGLNAKLVFSPDTTGVYYLEVREHDDDDVGTYTISIASDSPPKFTGSTELTVDENVKLRHRLVAVDEDPGHTVSGYSITGGADRAGFTVDANGVLSMASEPDFEDPQDADQDNTYEVEITVTSGPGRGAVEKSAVASFTVEVVDVAEPPSAPSGLRAVDVFADEVLFAWDAAENSGPPITNYVVRGLGVPNPDRDAGTALSIAYDGLRADQLYFLLVKAENAEGESPWSVSYFVRTDDCAADVETACSLSVGSSSTKRIDVQSAGDRDWFEVSLQSRTGYLIDAAASTGAAPLGDPYLKLYDSDGNAISGAEDNDGGSGQNAQLAYTADSTGAHYIEVSENGGEATGRYRVSIVVENRPRFTSSTQLTMLENSIQSFQVAAVDDDPDDSVHRFEITGGADRDEFKLTGDGVLVLKRPPNYEDPRDEDADNVYEVEITALSGPRANRIDGRTAADFTVTVENVVDEAPGTPRELRVVNEGMDAIKVSWEAPAEGAETVSGYQLEAASAGTASRVVDVGDVVVYEVGQLAASSKYQLRVRAVNDDGPSSWTGWIAAYTDDCPQDISTQCFVIPGGAANGRINVKEGVDVRDDDWFRFASSNSSYRIDVKGNTPADPGGTLANPHLRVFDADGNRRAGFVDNDSGFGLNASELLPLPNTTNHLEVRSAQPRGLGTYTVVATADRPAHVTSSDALSIEENDALAHRVVVADSDPADVVEFLAIPPSTTAVPDSHLFSIDEDGDLTMSFVPDYEDPQDHNGDNEYEFHVAYLSGPENGAKWLTYAYHSVTVTDADEPPGPPPNVRMVDQSLDSIKIAWDDPSNTGPGIDAQTARILETTPPYQWVASTVTPSAREHTFGGLAADTGYSIQVQASNAEGSGQWSLTLLARTDDCGATTATACPLSAQHSQTGHIGVSPQGDKDWYSVSLTAGETYRISVLGSEPSDSGGTLDDPELAVLDSSGSAITGERDDNGGAGLNAAYLFTPTASATYYIEVASSADNGTGTYTILYSEDNPPEFPRPGSVRLSVSEGTAFSHQLTATDPDPQDSVTGYFVASGSDFNRFAVTAGGLLTMTIDPDYENPRDRNQDNNYVVSVAARSGRSHDSVLRRGTYIVYVTITDSGGEAPGLARNPRATREAGTEIDIAWNGAHNQGPAITGYEVRISPDTATPAWTAAALGSSARTHTFASLSAGTRYQFQIKAENSDGAGQWSPSYYADTDDCPADTTTTCSLTAGSAETGKINISSSTPDKDWHSVNLAGSTLYSVEVSGSSTSSSVLAELGSGYASSDLLADPKLAVYDSTGAAITGAADDNSGSGHNAFLHFEAPSTGTYYIEVEGSSGADGWYSISVGTDSPPRFTGALQLSVQENTALNHRVTATDSDDGHSITGFEVAGGADSDKFAINSSGVLSMSITPDFERPQDADSDNVYEVLITVSSGEGGGAADRQSSAAFTVAVTDDNAETPDTPANVRIVDEGLRSIKAAWDQPATQGPAIRSYETEILDSAGQATEQTATVESGTGPYGIGGLEPGTEYNLRVSASGDEGPGDWSALAGFHTDSCSAAAGPDVCPLEPDEPQQHRINATSATNTADQDKDMFEVELAAGQKYRIAVKGADAADPGGTLPDPKLKIFDGDGNAIPGAFDDDGGSGKNASYDLTPTAAGYFAIQVSTGVLGDTGTYTISVVTVEPPRFTGSAALTLAENSSLSHQLAAKDSNAGDEIKGFAITGGADSDKFTIGNNDVLSMSVAPDFERPQDSDADNVYEVEITVTSGPAGLQAAEQASALFTVTVTDDDAEAPAEPGNLRIVSENGSRIAVQWDKPANQGPDISGYELELAEAAANGDVTSRSLAPGFTAYSYIISGLEPDQHYTLRVKASNEEGESPWTTAIDAYTDDCSARNDTDSCQIPVGGTAEGRINVNALGGDKDWFAVTLAAGGQYEIEAKGDTTGDHGGTLRDPELKLYDSDGNAIDGAADDDSGTGLNAKHFFKAPAADTYYIEVGDPGGDETGTYTISIADATLPRLTSSLRATVEENAALSHRLIAADDNPGHTVKGISITGGADSDRFSLDVDNVLTNAAVLTMTAAPDYENPQDADTDNVYEVEVTIVSGPPGSDNNLLGVATIRVTVTDDDSEAPQAPQNVRLVRAERTADGNTLDIGWDAAANSGPNVSAYTVRYAAPNLLGWQQTSVSSSARSFKFPADFAGAEYVVQIMAENAEGTSPWSVRLSVRSDACSAAVSNSCAITVDGTQTGRIDTNDQGQDKDWYAVTLVANTEYAIEVKGDDSDDPGGTLGDPYLKVHDSNGDSIAGAEDDNGGSGSNAKHTFTPTSSGVYYIEVGETGGNDVGTYTLTVAANS